MKHIKFCLIALMLTTTPKLWAQECTAIYEAAVSQMQKGRYTKAIEMFKAAMDCDKSLTEKCNQKINDCERKRAEINKKKQEEKNQEMKSALTLKEKAFIVENNETDCSTIHIVESSPITWKSSTNASWIALEEKTDNTIIVKYEENASVMERTSYIYINNGKLIDSVLVTQKGAEEFFEIKDDALSFACKTGGTQIISIANNGGWEIADKSDWIEIDRLQDNNKVSITVGSNKKNRDGHITFKSLSNKYFKTIQIHQQNVISRTLNREGKK